MPHKKLNIAVLGAGSWATALAHHMSLAHGSVSLWGRDEHVLAQIKLKHCNEKYFPGCLIHEGVTPCADIKQVVNDAELIICAVPSSAMRGVCAKIKQAIRPDAFVISAAKGLEDGTLKRMSEVIAEEIGDSNHVMSLSGPSFAKEVMEGLPTAIVLAGHDTKVVEQVASSFHYGNIRIYSSTDLIGVEIGGAVKNVIALAAGIVDGAGMGANARAALITRGLAELQRLVVRLGGEALTVAGLSGLGDLLLTSTSDVSRNRRVGVLLGKGVDLQTALNKVGQVVEGVITTPKALALSQKVGVEMPIVQEVHNVLIGNTSVAGAVANLLSRARAKEFARLHGM